MPARRARLSAAHRFDEVGTLMVLGNVLIPSEEILFIATRTRRASFAPPSTAIRPSKTCAAGGYGERVEWQEDLSATIERSLTVMCREKRHALLNVICRF